MSLLSRTRTHGTMSTAVTTIRRCSRPLDFFPASAQIGPGLCLVIAGLFFASRLWRGIESTALRRRPRSKEHRHPVDARAQARERAGVEGPG